MYNLITRTPNKSPNIFPCFKTYPRYVSELLIRPHPDDAPLRPQSIEDLPELHQAIPRRHRLYVKERERYVVCRFVTPKKWSDDHIFGMNVCSIKKLLLYLQSKKLTN